jgi:hypothetical protein
VRKDPLRISGGTGWPRKFSAAASTTQPPEASTAVARVCLESFSPAALVTTGRCA